MKNGSLLMTGIDLGGHHQVRRVWQDYYQSVDAVVFMVDAADPSRLTEAAEELKRVLDDNQLISEIPIALRDKYSSRPDLLKNVTSKFFTFLYFRTLFGCYGIDMNQKLGCDFSQKEFMIFQSWPIRPFC